jgi:hypothetical protein
VSHSAYHRSLEGARRVALALTAEQQQILIELLEEYGAEIEARIAAGLTGLKWQQVLREISLLIDELTIELASALRDGVHLTAARLAEIHARATAELLITSGSTLSVGEIFIGAGVRAAQAILARPELAEAFVTIRADAKSAANRIIRRGLVRGAPVQAIARELRQYIAMPDSLLEGDASILADRRRIGYAVIEQLGYERTPQNLALVRSEASQIAYRASRIARTEVMQAEREVFIQGAIDSPVVEAVEIRLSYRHTEPCACEPIVELDLYGLGPGRYDPRQVPPRPHPHCWCPHRSVLLPREKWGVPRGPLPDLKVELEREAEVFGLSPSGQRAFISAIEVGLGRETLQPVEA